MRLGDILIEAWQDKKPWVSPDPTMTPRKKKRFRELAVSLSKIAPGPFKQVQRDEKFERLEAKNEDESKVIQVAYHGDESNNVYIYMRGYETPTEREEIRSAISKYDPGPVRKKGIWYFIRLLV